MIIINNNIFSGLFGAVIGCLITLLLNCVQRNESIKNEAKERITYTYFQNIKAIIYADIDKKSVIDHVNNLAELGCYLYSVSEKVFKIDRRNIVESGKEIFNIYYKICKHYGIEPYHRTVYETHTIDMSLKNIAKYMGLDIGAFQIK